MPATIIDRDYVRDHFGALLRQRGVDPFLAGFAVADCIAYGQQMVEKSANQPHVKSLAEVYFACMGAQVFDSLTDNGYPESSPLNHICVAFRSLCDELESGCRDGILHFIG